MTHNNQSELDELDEIINLALTRIVLAFGADDSSLIPKIKSDARKGIEAYITVNYTPNSEVAERERLARLDELEHTFVSYDNALASELVENPEWEYGQVVERIAELKVQQEEV